MLSIIIRSTDVAELEILRPEQHAKWIEVLQSSFQYDFYHLPQYQALAEERGEGGAHLFLYKEGRYFVAIPLLVRPIDTIPCHAQTGKGWWDATSVYGYAGPIASHPDVPESVLHNFRSALSRTLQERQIVAVFSRLHPLIPQQGLLAGLGELVSAGQTVSIDLTLPVDVQRAQYRNNHKRDINMLRRLNLSCTHDDKVAFIDDFIEIYYETMRRAGASNAYFFEHLYFERLVTTLESTMHLFVCLLDNRVICGGLFALCDGIVQYHLGGTRNEFIELSPMKLLLDGVRLWANERQACVFHLGGGVGAQEDALFHFKAGFTDRRHEFTIWRWVLLPDVYDQLCEEKIRCSRQLGLDSVGNGFFPAYRCRECSQTKVAVSE